MDPAMPADAAIAKLGGFAPDLAEMRTIDRRASCLAMPTYDIASGRQRRMGAAIDGSTGELEIRDNGGLRIYPRAHRGYSTVDSSMGAVAPRRCVRRLGRRPPHRRVPPGHPRPPPAAAPPPQFRGNRERVARDAERERLILEWELGMRSLRTHNPVWAAAQPAALSAPLYHASLFQASLTGSVRARCGRFSVA
jgi:hypothetical protein